MRSEIPVDPKWMPNSVDFRLVWAHLKPGRYFIFRETISRPSRSDIIGISNSPFTWIYEQTRLPEHGLRLHLHIFLM